MSALRIFVRRGAIRRFNRLKRDAADLPVSVEWDRRQGERPADVASAPTEQPQADRRSEPPFTWNAAEFVVVDDKPEEV